MKGFRSIRTLLTGSVFAAAVVGLAGGPSALQTSSAALAQGMAPGDVMVPKFEADPYWPKPLPNQWILGNVIGISVDKNDNVWIVHRPGSLEYMETYLTRNQGDCCTAAPDVLEFDEAGNLKHHFGKVAGHDWPSSNHGILIDSEGNVWLGGNGARQPGPPPGSAAQFEGRSAVRGQMDEASGGGPGAYHDSFLLKLTQDGKFLGEIGKANGSKGSLDTMNVKGAAQMKMIPGTNEMIVADGYGNHRVSIWNPDTLQFIRMWGAYGKAPTDKKDLKRYDPNSPQWGNPVHCAVPSNDGLIYVCDRTNNRLQVFKTDGTYVGQYVIEPDTRGDGSIWEVAFSNDPEQKFLYIPDGVNEKVHVLDRKTMKELYSFGGGGRQPGQFYAVHSIATDSHGNIFTTETYRGQRVQKFVYKGMVPLSSLMKAGYVGNSKIYKAVPVQFDPPGTPYVPAK